jgi:hypothetical protein
MVKGGSADAAFEELRELTLAAGDRVSLAITMAGRISTLITHARIAEASLLASELIALLESAQYARGIVLAHQDGPHRREGIELLALARDAALREGFMLVQYRPSTPIWPRRRPAAAIWTAPSTRPARCSIS